MAITMTPIGSMRRNPASPWRHIDVLLIGATGAVASLGALMIYSSTRRQLDEQGLDPTQFLSRQIVWIMLGFLLMVVVAAIDYRVYRDFAWVLYGGVVATLVLVISPFGSESKGAQAWFQFGAFQLQPSEFAKPVLIVALAAYAAVHHGDLDLRRLVSVLAIAGLPLGLIYLQPDLGTIIVFIAVVMGVLLVAGVKGRHVAAITALGVIGVIGVFQLDVLADYQQARLTAFLDPADDLAKTAYNQHQSQIAIGAGGLTGEGLFQGSQTNLSYVPEQHTDFIFTAVGEELGLVGAATLLVLLGIIVYRCWRTAQLARDGLGALISAGVMAMFVFQIFQNVGMAMGIMPITGIPLPLMSYGGSSTLATFISLGLVLNVHMRRFA